MGLRTMLHGMECHAAPRSCASRNPFGGHWHGASIALIAQHHPRLTLTAQPPARASNRVPSQAVDSHVRCIHAGRPAHLRVALPGFLTLRTLGACCREPGPAQARLECAGGAASDGVARMPRRPCEHVRPVELHASRRLHLVVFHRMLPACLRVRACVCACVRSLYMNRARTWGFIGS